MQLEEYPPLSLQKRKSPAPIAELSSFHFPSAEKFSLHLAFGKRRTVVRLCKAQPFQILHFALKRLTDTQVACRLDWQGLIVFNILHFPCAVKKNSRYLPQIPGQARNDEWPVTTIASCHPERRPVTLSLTQGLCKFWQASSAPALRRSSGSTLREPQGPPFESPLEAALRVQGTGEFGMTDTFTPLGVLFTQSVNFYYSDLERTTRKPLQKLPVLQYGSL